METQKNTQYKNTQNQYSYARYFFMLWCMMKEGCEIEVMRPTKRQKADKFSNVNVVSVKGREIPYIYELTCIVLPVKDMKVNFQQTKTFKINAALEIIKHLGYEITKSHGNGRRTSSIEDKRLQSHSFDEVKGADGIVYNKKMIIKIGQSVYEHYIEEFINANKVTVALNKIFDKVKL